MMVVVAGMMLLMGSAGPAGAALTGYTISPQTNSVDWTNAVTLTGQFVWNIDFSAVTPGPLASSGANTYYIPASAATLGASFTVQGANVAIVNGAGPGDGGRYNQNTGEGTHATSNYMAFPWPGLQVVPVSITLSFTNPVSAVGVFTVDLSVAEPFTITAFDSTGASLGSATSVTSACFQPNYKYFMGVVSSANNIASVQVTGDWQNGYNGDNVGFSNFLFSSLVAPEPATLGLLVLGGLVLVLRRRQRA
ncbi:MAG: PEP-CTERM sorting domain-containing protein [Phycisphaerae bacterium]